MSHAQVRAGNRVSEAIHERGSTAVTATSGSERDDGVLRQKAARVSAPRGMPGALWTLPRRRGDRLVRRLVADAVPSSRTAVRLLDRPTPAAPLPVHVGDESGVGVVGEVVHGGGGTTPSLRQHVDEDGLLDGELWSDVVPEFPVDAGRTGTATVTRSFTGVLAGANGPDRSVTTRAVARADRHERLDVAGSSTVHFGPLLADGAAAADAVLVAAAPLTHSVSGES